jgi:hypothetical protein
MKWFAVILSVYVLFLTGLPCVDNPWENGKDVAGCSHNPADGHAPDTDLCSPFCVCDCCATQVVYMDNTVHFDGMSCEIPYFFIFTSEDPSTIAYSIWQPPKIG